MWDYKPFGQAQSTLTERPGGALRPKGFIKFEAGTRSKLEKNYDNKQNGWADAGLAFTQHVFHCRPLWQAYSNYQVY